MSTPGRAAAHQLKDDLAPAAPPIWGPGPAKVQRRVLLALDAACVLAALVAMVVMAATGERWHLPPYSGGLLAIALMWMIPLAAWPVSWKHRGPLDARTKVWLAAVAAASAALYALAFAATHSSIVPAESLRVFVARIALLSIAFFGQAWIYALARFGPPRRLEWR